MLKKEESPFSLGDLKALMKILTEILNNKKGIKDPLLSNYLGDLSDIFKNKVESGDFENFDSILKAILNIDKGIEDPELYNVLKGISDNIKYEINRYVEERTNFSGVLVAVYSSGKLKAISLLNNNLDNDLMLYRYQK